MIEIYRGIKFDANINLGSVHVPGKSSSDLLSATWKASLRNRALGSYYHVEGTVNANTNTVSFVWGPLFTLEMAIGVYDLEIFLSDRSFMWVRHRFARVLNSSAVLV